VRNLSGNREQAAAGHPDSGGGGSLGRRSVLGGLAALPVLYGVATAGSRQAAVSGTRPGSIEPEVMADYIRCFADPRAIAAVCADFRASPGADLAHDEESLAAGQKVQCPVLVIWGTQLKAGPGYDPPAIWQEYAPDVRGVALPTGHFIPEEAPDPVVDAPRDFLD
jgi:pimeloyl-ACP methyl ester carboxylesterase